MFPFQNTLLWFVIISWASAAIVDVGGPLTSNSVHPRTSPIRNWFGNTRNRRPQFPNSISAPELIQANGYGFESHEVTTKDGYILTLHRIPSPGRPVVLMFHGMTLTSRDFLMNHKHKAPAYKMTEAGFDVWLVNARGNTYSRAHVRLQIDDPAYWNFSVDEVIKYDAPAMVDYILEVTGQCKLNWIGYSLGSAVGMGFTSTQPEYNDKINLLILLGTTAYVGHQRSPALRLVTPFEGILDAMLTRFNHGEILPSFVYSILRTVLPILCLPEARLDRPGICALLAFLAGGFDTNQVNPQMFPLILGGAPGNLAVKMLTQWFQWINGGEFSYYNFGKVINMEKYGSEVPPNYALRNVTTRVVNLYSTNDWLSVPEDVQRVVRELPNVVLNLRIQHGDWTHMDCIYGRDADVYVYEEIVSAINMLTDENKS